jgi:protein SCO1/2
MENAAEELGSDGPKKVNLVFITIDPERDTTKLMKGYVTNFGPTIEGLTGTPEQIAAVAHAYRVYYQKVPGKAGDPYLMAHSSIIYLLDRRGRFIGHFPPDSTPEDIAKALRELL